MDVVSPDTQLSSPFVDIQGGDLAKVENRLRSCLVSDDGVGHLCPIHGPLVTPRSFVQESVTVFFRSQYDEIGQYEVAIGADPSFRQSSEQARLWCRPCGTHILSLHSTR